MKVLPYPLNMMVFAYVCGFLVYLAVAVLLIPVHIPMEKVRNERLRSGWSFLSHWLPAFAAGGLAMHLAFSLIPLAKYIAVAGLAATFIGRALRRMAEGFMSPAEVAGESVGFATGILLPPLLRV